MRGQALAHRKIGGHRALVEGRHVRWRGRPSPGRGGGGVVRPPGGGRTPPPVCGGGCPRHRGAGEPLWAPLGAPAAGRAGGARDAGYELVFTSVPALNPVRPAVGWLLGRTGFEASTVRDAKGRFRPDWLALYLFRKPRLSLVPDYSSSSADVR